MIVWMRSSAILLVSATTFACSGGSPATAQKPRAGCSAIAPADIRGPAVRWMGPCVAGKADGLGILRVGARPPFAFLIGRMRAGRPVSGHVIDTENNLTQVRGFSAQGAAILADGEHLREQDVIWADAVKAANSVANRFAATGNRASAAYYQNFANKIKNGRPE